MPRPLAPSFSFRGFLCFTLCLTAGSYHLRPRILIATRNRCDIDGFAVSHKVNLVAGSRRLFGIDAKVNDVRSSIVIIVWIMIEFRREMVVMRDVMEMESVKGSVLRLASTEDAFQIVHYLGSSHRLVMKHVIVPCLIRIPFPDRRKHSGWVVDESRYQPCRGACDCGGQGESHFHSSPWRAPARTPVGGDRDGFAVSEAQFAVRRAFWEGTPRRLQNAFSTRHVLEFRSGPTFDFAQEFQLYLPSRHTECQLRDCTSTALHASRN
ncbi:hypothetical protein MRB53_040728 [Persea americana]|nr:hypothetical protein MRB53_040728 [Persea americana]